MIGFMGAGKTTIGKQLAQKFNLPFVDVDQFVEEREGISIADIFEREGEASFRLRETKSLQQLSDCSPSIISTGGGIVERQENIDEMKHHGQVIYLSASFATLYERVADDTTRPLTSAGKSTLHERFQMREAYYENAADLVVDTEGRSISETCDFIVEQLGNNS
nr:shikimate kinase [Texcoconibacillus texcoconensis]